MRTIFWKWGKGKSDKKKTPFERMLRQLMWFALIASYICIIIISLQIILPSRRISIEFQSYLLPIILVFGIIDLVCVLTLSSGILHHFGLSNPNEALGLPSGSVRALIALFLIVIFAIMAVFMQGQLSPYPLRDVNGTILRDINGTAIMIEPSQGQRDFSLQTLTTVSTLVVAVSGFYFGTKAAVTDRGKIEEIKVTIVPKDFVKVNSEEELTIKVKTEPENKVIYWKVDGDTPKSLVHEKPNEFKYKPSKKPVRTKDIVILTFNAVEKPEAQEKLIVEVVESAVKK